MNLCEVIARIEKQRERAENLLEFQQMDPSVVVHKNIHSQIYPPNFFVPPSIDTNLFSYRLKQLYEEKLISAISISGNINRISIGVFYNMLMSSHGTLCGCIRC